MEKIAQGRSFSLLNKPKTLCLAFTSDNKYLLSSHEQARVIVWSIIDNEVYKEYEIKTKQNIIWLCFTPDNQFMVSVFEKSRESNIWNNYIGKISSNRNIEKIAFTPEIKTIDANYRR
jgi:WD40 repeat protein